MLRDKSIYIGGLPLKDLAEKQIAPEKCHPIDRSLSEKTEFKLGIDSPLIAEKVAPVAANIHLKTGTKAEGIHKICDSMNITAKQALAFGDEEMTLPCLML